LREEILTACDSHPIRRGPQKSDFWKKEKKGKVLESKKLQSRGVKTLRSVQGMPSPSFGSLTAFTKKEKKEENPGWKGERSRIL